MCLLEGMRGVCAIRVEVCEVRGKSKVESKSREKRQRLAASYAVLLCPRTPHAPRSPPPFLRSRPLRRPRPLRARPRDDDEPAPLHPFLLLTAAGATAARRTTTAAYGRLVVRRPVAVSKPAVVLARAVVCGDDLVLRARDGDGERAGGKEGRGALLLVAAAALCDIVVVVGTGELPAHQVLVREASLLEVGRGRRGRRMLRGHHDLRRAHAQAHAQRRLVKVGPAALGRVQRGGGRAEDGLQAVCHTAARWLVPDGRLRGQVEARGGRRGG